MKKLLLVTVLAMFAALIPARADQTLGEKTDEAVIDTKESARSVKRKTKKAARDVTGKESLVKDARDRAEEVKDNAKDRAEQAKDKLGE